MSSADFEEGEMIFHLGDPSDKLYLISSGTAEAPHRTGAEEETQIATFGQGDLWRTRTCLDEVLCVGQSSDCT